MTIFDDNYYVIRGEKVLKEEYHRQMELTQEEKNKKYEEKEAARRLADIGEVIPKLWDLLDLHKGKRIVLDEDRTRFELRYALFQAMAVELTGETWEGEVWC